MERFIKRSAPPDGLTDEQHQEWLLEHASEQFAKIGKTDDQRKKLRLTADVGAALEDDAGGSTFLSSIFLFAPPLSLPVPLLCPLLVILCDTGRPRGWGVGGGRRGEAGCVARHTMPSLLCPHGRFLAPTCARTGAAGSNMLEPGSGHSASQPTPAAQADEMVTTDTEITEPAGNTRTNPQPAPSLAVPPCCTILLLAPSHPTMYVHSTLLQCL